MSLFFEPTVKNWIVFVLFVLNMLFLALSLLMKNFQIDDILYFASKCAKSKNHRLSEMVTPNKSQLWIYSIFTSVDDYLWLIFAYLWWLMNLDGYIRIEWFSHHPICLSGLNFILWLFLLFFCVIAVSPSFGFSFLALIRNYGLNNIRFIPYVTKVIFYCVYISIYKVNNLHVLATIALLFTLFDIIARNVIKWKLFMYIFDGVLVKLCLKKTGKVTNKTIDEAFEEVETTLAKERKKHQEATVDPAVMSEEERKEFEEDQEHRAQFAKQVKSDILSFKENIDVSYYCQEYGWTEEKIEKVFDDFLWNSPDIFFVPKACYQIQTLTADDKTTSCFIKYLQYSITKAEYDKAKRELDKEVAYAKTLLEGVDDPVKKALILHDHIIRVCEYDIKSAKNHDSSPLARTAYSVLVRHLAVCEGYTMAYRYLLKNCAGIESEEVISDTMGHCWNYLKINGNWYHVDVTWDDPVYQGRKPDKEKISHHYFLLSDDKIARKNPSDSDYHHDWSLRGVPPATDTSFDETDWDNY